MSKNSDNLVDFFKSYADTEELLDFRIASDVAEKAESVSTGSPSLDDALGSNGFAHGRLSQVYGRPHSGKTLMTLLAMKEAQKKDPKSKQLFIDSEGTFSSSWAEILGIDISRIAVIDGETAVNGRKLFTMLLGSPKEDGKKVYAGKSKKGLLDHIAEKTPGFEFNFIVLDSIGSIIPPIEDVAEIGKSNMSTLARFLTAVMKKLSLDVKKANVPFVMINHNRDSMEMYGPDHTFSGGNTYTHSLSANIYFETVQRKDAQILNEKEQKIGSIIRATVEKTKYGPTPRKVEFKVDFTRGIVDRYEEIANLALGYDVVSKPTAVSHTYKDYKWVGFNNYAEALKENKALCDELEQEVIKAREGKLDKKRAEQQKTIEVSDDVDIDSNTDITEKTTKKKGK